MISHRLRAFFLCACAAFGLASCLDQESTLILNPDGSGKVIVTATFDAKSLQTLASKVVEGLSPEAGGTIGADKNFLSQKDMQEAFLNMAVGVINGSEGVEAWTDCKTQMLPDGRAQVVMRGFFKDANQLSLLGWSGEAEEGNGASEAQQAAKPSFLLKQEGNGQSRFRIPAFSADSASKLKNKLSLKQDKPGPAAEKESAAMSAEEKQESLAMLALMEPMLQGLRLKLNIRPAGPIVDAGGFTLSAGNSQASLELAGANFIKTARLLYEEDESARSNVAGKTIQEENEKLAKMLFGFSKEPALLIGPAGGPSFDYAGELRQAQARLSPEMKTLLQKAAEEKTQESGQ